MASALSASGCVAATIGEREKIAKRWSRSIGRAG
jgi:hypothetical protein